MDHFEYLRDQNGMNSNGQQGQQVLNLQNAVTFGYRQVPQQQYGQHNIENGFQMNNQRENNTGHSPIEDAMQSYPIQNGQQADPGNQYQSNHHQDYDAEQHQGQTSEENRHLRVGVDRVEEEEEEDETAGTRNNKENRNHNQEQIYEEHGEEEDEDEQENDEDEDEHDDEDEYYEEDNRDELICLQCSKQVEQALVLACDHRLCLDCAAAQYIASLRSAGLSVNSNELLSTIDCQACGIPTPLTRESIAVLLSLEQDNSLPIVNDQSQTQQISAQQLNDSFNNRNISQSQQHQEIQLQSPLTQQTTQLSTLQSQQQLQQLQQQQQQDHADHDEDDNNHDNQQDQVVQQFESTEAQQAQQQSTFLSQPSLTLSQSHVQNHPNPKKNSPSSGYSPNFQHNNNELNRDDPRPPPFSYTLPQQQQQQLQQHQQQQQQLHVNQHQLQLQQQQLQFQQHKQQNQNFNTVSSNVNQQQRIYSQQGSQQPQQASMQGSNPIDSPFQARKQPIGVSNNSDPNDQRILFCFSCFTSCFTLDEYLKGLHRNHNVKNVSKSYEELQEPIEELLHKIKGKKNELLLDDSRLNKKRQELDSALDECKNKIKTSFKELIEALSRKEQELLSNVDETAQEKSNELNRCREKVLGNINVVEEFENNVRGVYYQQERDLSSEINAFDYYAQNKDKMVAAMDEINSQLSYSIRDKLTWEFQIETDSLNHHIESIKGVKVQVNKLNGVERIQHQSDLKKRFYETHSEDKSKQLLQHILSSQPNSNQINNKPNLVSNGLIGNENINGNGNYNSLISSNNFRQVVNQEKTNEFGFNGNIFQSSPLPAYHSTHQQSQNEQQYLSIGGQMSARQSNSPHRFLKIKPGSQSITDETSKSAAQISLKRQQRSSINNNNSSSFQPLSDKSHNSLPFKTFLINSPSAKQEFSNILSSPSVIVKKYTPSSYESLILLHAGELNQNHKPSHSQHSSSSSLYSKIGVLDALRKNSSNKNFLNFDGRKQQSLATEESLNSITNSRQEYASRSTNDIATIAAQNRIKQLQQKLVSKYN